MAAGDLITGSLSSVAAGTAFQPFATRPFNVFLTGTFVGTLTLERSYDGGTTWNTVPKPDLTAMTFTAPVNFIVSEPLADVTYRWNMTARTSGTAAYRFEQ